MINKKSMLTPCKVNAPAYASGLTEPSLVRAYLTIREDAPPKKKKKKAKVRYKIPMSV